MLQFGHTRSGHYGAEDLINQEAEKPDTPLDPFGIGDEGDPLPACEAFHADFEVLPGSAQIEPAEIRAGLIIERPAIGST